MAVIDFIWSVEGNYEPIMLIIPNDRFAAKTVARPVSQPASQCSGLRDGWTVLNGLLTNASFGGGGGAASEIGRRLLKRPNWRQ